jgi:hypothetical protein
LALSGNASFAFGIYGPGAGNYPTSIRNCLQHRLPACSGFACKHNGGDSVSANNPATLGKCFRQLALVELNVMCRIAQFVRAIDNNFLLF